MDSRGRGARIRGASGRTTSKNKKWVAGQDSLNGAHGSDAPRWERGGHWRRSGSNRSSAVSSPQLSASESNDLDDAMSGTEDDHSGDEDTAVEDDAQLETDMDVPDPETPQDRERFWQELVKARELERKKAIAEGKMDDPMVSKRLDEAITMVGTCMDMCPRFERYRRERENNLDKWEVIPGTKRVDHKRAVKIYERAAGDKTLPSDLRPPPVLKKTLDYLFHELLVERGFTQTYDFIRDRSRAVRNDFTMQHEQALHLERDNPRFSVALEEQQLMNTLQSLKEFYEDQRGKYQALTELEMRVYHRLVHIRDQRERREDIPAEITSHPVFQYTTQFRQIVQAKSAPITKSSPLVVDAEGMQIFAKLAAVLREQGNVVMIYLVACILERLFGKDTIEDIEAIRGDLSTPQIIDGISQPTMRVSFTNVAPPSSSAHVTAHMPNEHSQPTPSAFSQSSRLAATPGTSFPSLTQSQSFVTTDAVANPASTAPPTLSAFNHLTSVQSAFAPKSAFGGATGGSAFGARNPFGVNGSSSTVTSAFAGTSQSTPPSQVASSQSVPSIFSGASFTAAKSGSSFPMSQAAVSSTVSPTGGIPNEAPPKPASAPPAPQGSTLNPLAPTFSSPKANPFAVPSLPSSSTARNVGGNHASSQEHALSTSFPPTSTPNVYASSSGQSTTSIPQPSIPPQSTTSQTTVSQPIPPPTSQTPTRTSSTAPSSSHIVERRETLWEIPSTASLKSQTTTAPILYPINTNTPSLSSAPVSPIAPPPVKVQPLDLPPTPTARWFDPSSQPQTTSPLSATISRKRSLFGFPPLEMPSSSTAEMLSPLQLTPPTSFQVPSSPSSTNGTTSQLQTPAAVAPSPITAQAQSRSHTEQVNGRHSPKGKGKAAKVELNAEALKFLNRSSLVKNAFKRWKRKATAWAEACERSEAYTAKAKLRRERMSSSYSTGAIVDANSSQQTKRRRMSVSEPSRARRGRKWRTLDSIQPIQEEELIRCLKERFEETQRRWEPGSFLRSVREYVKSVNQEGRSLDEWRLWLSMNTENDSTAIWVERKFNVPDSGIWDSDSVFSIPAHTNSYDPTLRGSPGLIVFERTSLADINDDIERKYRVLDDCARLRDLVENLPPLEHLRYTPSLVVINWSNSDEVETIPDFETMTAKLKESGVFEDVATLVIPSNSTAVDATFRELLSIVKLNLHDRLSQSLSWKELTDLFVSPFRVKASDWLDSCWANQTLDWYRFGHVQQAIKDAQNQLAASILELIGSSSTIHVDQPPIDTQALPRLGPEYMQGSFLDSIVGPLVSAVERALKAHHKSTLELPRVSVESTVSRFEASLQSQTYALLALRHTGGKQTSPKRRATDDHIEEFLTALHSRKRMRSSISSEGRVALENKAPSESPSLNASIASVDSSRDIQKPKVTLAMLRSLSQDVLKAYGRR